MAREKGAPARERGGPWIWLCALVMYPVTFLFGKLRRRNGPGIPPTGGALLVMNHVSHLDPIYDAVSVHRSGRVPRFMAKNTLWDIPVVGRILVGAGQIPVYRGTSDARQSLRAAEQALRDGKIVLIYPEGTISKDPQNWPMHSRTGVARLALDTDVPVIPAARFGTQRILNGYTKTFRPLPRKRVDFVVGEPVDMAAYRARPQDPALLREVTDQLMVRVRDLLGEVRGETPPVEFYPASKAARAARPASPTTQSATAAPESERPERADGE